MKRPLTVATFLSWRGWEASIAGYLSPEYAPEYGEGGIRTPEGF